MKRDIPIKGMTRDSKLNPMKAKCNNCGATITYTRPNIISLSDSLGSEVFYCPDCGPGPNAEDLDGVSGIER